MTGKSAGPQRRRPVVACLASRSWPAPKAVPFAGDLNGVIAVKDRIEKKSVVQTDAAGKRRICVLNIKASSAKPTCGKAFVITSRA
jgi:hypothetical protein